jgi:hypothetical protein
VRCMYLPYSFAVYACICMRVCWESRVFNMDLQSSSKKIRLDRNQTSWSLRVVRDDLGWYVYTVLRCLYINVCQVHARIVVCRYV